MHFARGIKLTLLFLICQLVGFFPSYANDIPALTWERGKTLNVVLGGFTNSVDWEIFLENSGSSLAFSQSQANSSGFVVFTVNLSKELPIGQYEVVAREPNSEQSLLAVVQVVDRFQYSILEIPRDLFFLLFFTFLILFFQLNLRSWYRYQVLDETKAKDSLNVLNSNNNILVLLYLQRARWKERWLGSDFSIHAPTLIPWKFLAILPLFSVMLVSYASLGRFWEGSIYTSSVLILMLLAAIGVADQYSAKLTAVSASVLFLLINGTLNMPSVLNFIFILGMLFLPKYVGEVSYIFCTLSLVKFTKSKELSAGFSSVVAGASVFYLYLLSESVLFGAGTNASKVTPIAIAVSLINLLLTSKAASTSLKPHSSHIIQRAHQPLVTLRMISLLLLVAVLTLSIWSGSVVISALTAFLWLGGLIGIHFVPTSRVRIWVLWLENPMKLLFFSILLLAIIIFILKKLPLVVQDYSQLILFTLGIEIFIIAFITLLVSPKLSDRKSLDKQEPKEGLR